MEWRFWSVADGLTESNTSGVTVDGAGVAWAKHGGTTLTRLDGTSVSLIPDPFEGGRLSASKDGDLWLLKGRDLRRYRGGRWQSYILPDFPDVIRREGRQTDPSAFCPIGRGRVLVMTRSTLFWFDSNTRKNRVFVRAESTKLKVFLAMRLGFEGAVWVTGERGAARIAEPSVGAGLQWKEFSAPSNLKDFAEPREGESGELFVSAVGDGKPVLVRMYGKNWKVLYKGERALLRGWRGGDHDIWISDGNKVMRVSGSHLEVVDRTEAFSGLLQNAHPARNGAFWITTSQGIARYTAPLWRTDTPMRGEDMDDLVGASCEDAKGSVWFLSSRYLSRFDGKSWAKYPLPANPNAVTVATDALKALPNGDVAIATSTPDMLIFHPGTGVFENLHHPQGRVIRVFGKRRDGRLFAQTLNPADHNDFRIEIFDGRRFIPWLDLHKGWGFWDVRAIYETVNGDVWFGAVNGLGAFSKGKYRYFKPEDGIGREGAFTVFELSPGHLLVGGRRYLREFDGRHWVTLHCMVDRVRNISRAPDGTLWMASGMGVHHFKNGNWITTTAEDGLPSTVVYNVLADSQGRVWAGTTRGLSRYYNEADMDPPVTRISEELNSPTVAPDGTTRILFSGMDKWKMTESNRLLFSYRMDGGSWSAFDSPNSAHYRGLKSGFHRFEVRSMDRNGNIDPSPPSFDFSVLVPWYRQAGFLLLAAAALLAIALLLRSAWLRHRKLAFDSCHDPLTRLSNRRAFEGALQKSINQAADDRSRVAVLLLDLDRFKPVNDTLGHAAGDAFLQEVASRLRSCLGTTQTLARIGGDEFAIVLPDTARSGAEDFAVRILDRMRAPCRISDREFSTTASIGISLYPDHATDVASLQRLADLAMYDCKAQSRDGYRVFEARMNAGETRNGGMATLIRDSLEKGFFRLHYQPILNPDGECYAAEALLRMDHPDAGRIPPMEFIPVAEETGLIVPLGQWVLRGACRQLSEWRCAGNNTLRVSVNISPVQLARPDFVETVIQALDEGRLEPRGLILEITETAMVSHWREARSKLEELRGMGISIALDDFGTGYSSLSSLHLLPVDYVKIDKSFTQRIDTEEKGSALVEGILRMAHQLGFRVIAEGVETAAQHSFLERARCDLVQGFLLGRPGPEQEISRLLESNRSLCL